MDKKTKILFVVFGLLIIFSIFFTYYRFFVVHDYTIEQAVTAEE